MNVAGVVKDCVMIYLSYLAFGSPVTMTNIVGFVISVLGVNLYNRRKRTLPPPPPAPGMGAEKAEDTDMDAVEEAVSLLPGPGEVPDKAQKRSFIP